MKTTNAIGSTVRALRLRRHLSQRTTAVAAGMTSAQLCNIEHGRSDVAVPTFVRLAGALGVTLDELASGSAVDHRERSAKSKHVGARTLDGDISAIRRSAGAKGLKSRWGESRRGWIRTRVELSPEAAKMLDKMPREKRGPFVSAAIIKG